ncbi:hypothetical protein [Pedobacter panaciterrae]
MYKQSKVRIGLFGIGLQAYWDQFTGLKQRLTEYIEVVAKSMETFDAEIVNLGLIDTPEKAFDAGLKFKQVDVDLIFLYATTYALSSTVLPVVRKAGVLVIVLNLAPQASIDYKSFNSMESRTAMTGEWLAYCSSCSVPEIANVFRRSNIPFFQVTGLLYDDAHVWTQIQEWIQAAQVARTMQYNRLGVMGNYYGGMLDIYTDLTLQCATFGGHIEILEVDELSALRTSVTDTEIEEKLTEIKTEFDVQDDCLAEELHRAAKTAVALDKLVDKYDLGSFAYYHKGTGNAENENTVTSVILGNSLLTGKHVPVAERI